MLCCAVLFCGAECVGLEWIFLRRAGELVNNSVTDCVVEYGSRVAVRKWSLSGEVIGRCLEAHGVNRSRREMQCALLIQRHSTLFRVSPPLSYSLKILPIRAKVVGSTKDPTWLARQTCCFKDLQHAVLDSERWKRQL